MSALIWKEVRERLLWALALIAAVMIAVLAGGYTFQDLGGLGRPPWFLAAVVIAAFMGASTYASELNRDKAAFLFARPVTWRKVLFVKLAVGIGILLVAGIAGAIAFRLMVPELYLRIAGPADLAKGVGISVLLTGWPFLMGFSCSTLLPGAGGGVLVMAAQAAAVILFVTCATDAMHGATGARVPALAALWPLAALAGALNVARWGLSSPLAVRLRRYVWGFLPVLAALALIVGLAPQWLVNRVTGDYMTYFESISISPDGNYAMVYRGSHMRVEEASEIYWIDLKSGRSRFAYRDYHCTPRWTGPEIFNWSPPHTYYVYTWWVKGPWTVTTYQPGPRGTIRARVIRMGASKFEGRKPMQAIPSPSGRIAAFCVLWASDTREKLVFADIQSARKLPVELDLGDSLDLTGYQYPGNLPIWWQSENEIGYQDKKGRVRTLRVQ